MWMLAGAIVGTGLFAFGYRFGSRRESEDAARMRDEVGDFLEQGRHVMERLRGRDRRRTPEEGSAANGEQNAPLTRAERKEQLRARAARTWPELYGKRPYIPGRGTPNE